MTFYVYWVVAHVFPNSGARQKWWWWWLHIGSTVGKLTRVVRNSL